MVGQQRKAANPRRIGVKPGDTPQMSQCYPTAPGTGSAPRATVRSLTALLTVLIPAWCLATPSVPTALSVTPASATQLQLTWTASTGTPAIAAYLVQRCSGASCTNYSAVATVTSGTAYLDTGLTAATTYRYQVAAKDTAGTTSAYTAAISGTTQPSSATGGVTYGYDALGRLVQASSPALGAVTSYGYDGSGNITAVNSTPLSKLAITGTSTSQGSAGSTITIFGSGFPTTPGSNTVTFNGKAATVVSATATQLVVTVPSGATTGSIAIKVGTTTVTSSSSFTPLPSAAAPTLSAIAPLVAASGTPITLSGTGFATSVGATRVRVNQTWATVTAASATSVTAIVPNQTTSGRITVTTPTGSVRSTSDFLIPPSGVSTTAVAGAGRITVNGAALPITAKASGPTLLALFDRGAGAPASLVIGAGAASGTLLTVYGPDGTVAISATPLTGSAQRIVLPIAVRTGTYTATLSPTGVASNFSVQLVGPPTTPLTVGAAPTSVSLTNPGEPIVLTFAGTANQSVTVALRNVTLASSTVTLLSPTGATVLSQPMTTSGLTLYATLPAAGTYSVLVQPGATLTGALFASVATTTTAATLTTNQAPTSLTVTSTGSAPVVSFVGAPGQYLSLALLESGGSIASLPVTVLNPDGTSLSTGVLTAACPATCSGSTVINLGPLPQSGAYLAVISPPASGSGSIQLALASPVPLNLGSATTGSANVSIPGQGVLASFSVTAGQPFFVQSSGLGSTTSTVILDPTGATTPAGPFVATLLAGNYGPVVQGGTYTALVTQSTAQTGTLTVTETPAVVGSLAAPAQSTVSVGGVQPVAFTFNATAGQYFSAVLSEANSTARPTYVSGGVLSVQAPNGQVIAATGFSPTRVVCVSGPCSTPPTFECTSCPPDANQYYGAAVLNFGPMPESGTYRLVFQDAADSTPGGVLTFSLATTTSGVAALGSTVQVSIPAGDFGVVGTFPGVTGQFLSVATSSGSLTLVGPDGATLSPTASSASVVNIVSAPLTGTYSLVDQHTSGTSAAITVSTPVTGTLTVGTPKAMPLALPGQAATLTFAGTAGQLLTLTAATSGSVSSPNYMVLNPDGSTLVAATATPAIPPLPVSGTYTVIVAQQTAGVGTITLTLATAAGVTGPQNLDLTQPNPGQAVIKPLVVAADQTLVVEITGLAFTGGVNNALVQIKDPMGGVVATTYCYAGTSPCTVPVPLLVAAGTYSLVVTPQGSGTMVGTATVTAMARGTLTLGTPVPINLASVGQNGAWTFVATAGQSVVLAVSGVSTVPSGGSYTITVTGPGGAGVASGTVSAGNDYLVNLPNLTAGLYTVTLLPSAAQTGTATLSLNSAVTGVLPADGAAHAFTSSVAGANAYLTLSAPRGQPLMLALTGLPTTGAAVTITGINGTPQPGVPGPTVAQATCAAAGCVIGPFAAPTDAPVTVVIQPTTRVALTLSATLSQAITGSLVLATPQAVSLTKSGQAAVLTFDVTTGGPQTDSLVISTTSTTPATNAYNVTVWNVNGTATVTQFVPTAPTVVNLGNLPPGTYTVTVVPQVPATGQLSLTLGTAVTDALPLGSLRTETLATSGQSATLTFTLPTAGVPYAVNLVGSSVAPTSAAYTVQIVAPDGTVVASGQAGAGTTTYNLEGVPAGAYSATLVPTSPSTGTFQVQVVNGVQAALPSAGTGVAVSTPVVGEDASLTFSGQAGQTLSLALTNVSVSPAGQTTVTVQIVNPDGTTFTNLACQIPACELRVGSLPKTGTYTAVVKPGTLVTMSLAANVSNDVTGTLTVGSTTTATLAAVGQNASLTFAAATAGQSLVLGLTASGVSPSTAAYTVTVTDPTGTSVGTTSVTAASPGILNWPPTLVGTYRVSVTPQTPATGTVKLQLATASVTSVPTTGAATPVSTGVAGANATLTFSATAGTSLSLVLTGIVLTPSGAQYLSLQFNNPDGTSFGSNTCSLPSCIVRLQGLRQTGTFSIVINPNSTSTLSFSAFLVPDVTKTLVSGTPAAVSLTMVGQSASLRIPTTAGQSLNVTLSGLASTPSGTNYFVSVYDPNGSLISYNSLTAGANTVQPISNATAGTYTVTVVPLAPATGSFSAVFP